MKNRTITFVLIILVLFIYLLYFALQFEMFSFGKPIVEDLNNIIIYAKTNRWEKAHLSIDNLTKNWNRQKYLLSFNYAEADYSLFLENISRLRGAIEIKDISETVSLASSSLILWNNFIKLVPEP